MYFLPACSLALRKAIFNLPVWHSGHRVLNTFLSFESNIFDGLLGSHKYEGVQKEIQIPIGHKTFKHKRLL